MQIRIASGFVCNREYSQLSDQAKLAFFELLAMGGESSVSDFEFEAKRKFPAEELKEARLVDADGESIWITSKLVGVDHSTDRVRKCRQNKKAAKIEAASMAPVISEPTAVSEEVVEVVAAPASTAIQMPWEGIKDLYNQIVAVHGGPQAKVINDSMKAKMKARLRDIAEYHSKDVKTMTQAEILSAFKWLFTVVAECDFLVGKVETRDGPFFAGLNWIIGSENYTKTVLDKKYQNRKPAQKTV